MAGKTSSLYYSQLATKTPGSPGSQTPYDEERLACGPAARSCWRHPSKYLQYVPRPRKVTVCLLLIDLMIVGLLVRALEPLITLLGRNEELFQARVTLSRHNIHASSPHPNLPKIPRILHQTCANDTIPDKWVESQRSCKQAYSNFEYKLWTDNVARNFIASEYPWFLDSWNNYAFPIQRADSIRYLILYHYGGLYLDMDTWCNETFPLDQIESGDVAHTAVFKSTLPTGVTNDFMISSARHPVYASIVSKLPVYYMITRFWARLQPYVNIMLSSGPLFLSLVVKDYMLEQPSLPSPAIQVVTPSELTPYITDLESSTWHKADAQALMWLGVRPWTWFALGAAGLVAGLYVANYLLLSVWKALRRRIPSVAYAFKMAKFH